MTDGVAEALIATAAGISIAVVTLIPYNYFLARVERETEVLETATPRLEVALNASAKDHTCLPVFDDRNAGVVLSEES